MLRGAFAILYMLLVDAQPPVVRATVLIVATYTAVYLGRRRVSFNVLAFAGLIVLWMNPVDLFNVGPQLSFLRGRADGDGAGVAGDDARRGKAGYRTVARRAHWAGRIAVRLRGWLPRWILPQRQPAAIEKLLEQERSWLVRMLWLGGRVVRRFTLVSGAIWLLTMPWSWRGSTSSTPSPC